MQVPCETSRSQLQNRVAALGLLRARLWALEAARVGEARAAERRGEVGGGVGGGKGGARAGERRGQRGSGMRGDKRRTVRAQDGTVVDHVTGRRWEMRGYLRGAW